MMAFAQGGVVTLSSQLDLAQVTGDRLCRREGVASTPSHQMPPTPNGKDGFLAMLSQYFGNFANHGRKRKS